MEQFFLAGAEPFTAAGENLRRAGNETGRCPRKAARTSGFFLAMYDFRVLDASCCVSRIHY
jgi:hypothetical protein